MAPAEARRTRVPSEQRIFSLVLALVASPHGLTKRELLSTVHGYADRYRHGETDASLERQFERDKDQLRELGIPIETIDSPQEPGNNRLTRYRISKRRLQMPAEIAFDQRELSLLRLAALAWSEGSLTAESRRSAMKIEALGAGLDVQHLGIAPSLGPREPAAPTLRRAVDEGRVVTFDYRLPGREQPLSRRVAPLRLHRADGRWHLIAHDLDRAADRVFLLARITGQVRIETARYDPELSNRADAIVADLLRLEQEQRVTVEAQRGSVAEARLLSRVGGPLEQPIPGRITLGTLDLHEFAAELAGYGDQVVVRDPPALRDEVTALLLAVRDQHEGGHGPVGHRRSSVEAQHGEAVDRGA